MNKISVFHPSGALYNKQAINKGWIVAYSMTPQQVYDFAPLMSDAAVALEQPNGSVRIYDDLDTFNIYKADLIKHKVLEPSKVNSHSYTRIDDVLSHRRRVENKVNLYLAKIGKHVDSYDDLSSNVSFFIHEDDRDSSNPVPKAVVIYVADEKLFDYLPDEAPTFYSSHGMASVVLSNDDYLARSEELFEQFQFGFFRKVTFTNDLEIFKGSTVKMKEDFVAPRTNQEEFYITSEEGITEKAIHKISSGHQSAYGEDLAYQEVEIAGKQGQRSFTYEEINKQYRPATQAEIENYKNAGSTIKIGNDSGFEKGSLADLIANARSSKPKEKEVFRTPEGAYKALRVPDTLNKYWTPKDGDIYAFPREDMIRVLKMDPDFPMPSPDNARISEATVWLNELGASELMENLKSVPNVNDRSIMISPTVKDTGKKVTSRYLRSAPFHPHFLQLNSLAEGATIDVNGRTAVYNQYTDVKNPDDIILRLRSVDTKSGVTREILLPDSMVPEGGCVTNGNEVFKVVKPNPGMRSVLEVTYREGDKAWYINKDLFDRITPPSTDVNPMHSDKAQEVFAPVAKDATADELESRRVGRTELMDVFGDDLSEAENTVYNRGLESAGAIVPTTKRADRAELENAGQLALFGSAEETIKAHGRLVISKAEEFKQKAAEHLNSGESPRMAQTNLPIGG